MENTHKKRIYPFLNYDKETDSYITDKQYFAKHPVYKFLMDATGWALFVVIFCPPLIHIIMPSKIATITAFCPLILFVSIICILVQIDEAQRKKEKNHP
jgi:predicted ABC-type exoprotein transport system permease subunit